MEDIRGGIYGNSRKDRENAGKPMRRMKVSPVSTTLLPALSNNFGEEKQERDFHNERKKNNIYLLVPLISCSRPFRVYDNRKSISFLS